MEEWTIIVSGTFDAAHMLPDYKGKCKKVHGHTWKVEIAVKKISLNHLGIGMDFSVLKKMFEAKLEMLDHNFLNNVITRPTAENIAKWIYNELNALHLEWVKVWETENNCVIYKENEVK